MVRASKLQRRTSTASTPASKTTSPSRDASRPKGARFSLNEDSTPAAAPSNGATPAAAGPTAAFVRALGELSADRRRLDRVIAQARRGRAFTPAQLIALQAQVYRLNQDMEVVSRVIDKAVGAVKTTLNTQV